MKFREELKKIVADWINPEFANAISLPQAVDRVAIEMFRLGYTADDGRDQRLILEAIDRFHRGESITDDELSPEPAKRDVLGQH